jgi:hypothetical protein
VGLFRRNVREIAADPALRAYGAALALLHVLGFLNWRLAHPLAEVLAPSQPPICWPFFEACHAWRPSAGALEAMLWVYLALAIVTLAGFARARLAGPAWCALGLLLLVNASLLFQDYRLRLNQHYMAAWVTLAFLLVPGKRRAIPYLVLCFYVFAGLLKFDRDWISGAALYGIRPLGVPEALIPAACVYVILLELVVVFGLLARNPWVFMICFAQVLLFHVASWPIVGFFYPTLMFAILAIFPLLRWLPGPSRPLGRGGYALLGAFAALQALPHLFPGDSAVTGEGRLFALHMFDAPLECQAWATIHASEDRERDVALRAGPLPPRIRCDPIVYWNLAKGLCRRFGRDARFIDLDLHLRTRRRGESEVRPVVELAGFCRADPSYDLWRPNPWIRSGD